MPESIATETTQEISYRGRFAPSPTGQLHMGSLVAALGSYLDAKANQGEWLLRIEDIDPPREEPGAKSQIPRQLEQHGLEWDDSISYQSAHTERYRDILNHLNTSEAIYRCSCSRQQIREMNGIYDGRCQLNPPDKNADAALRLKIDGYFAWQDHVQGSCRFNKNELGGDFIIHRKDGLFSYQLAVAIDDHDQGITHVVRGADLLDSTARQGFVMNTLDWQIPAYAHLPMIMGKDGHKLSKQTQAPVLDSEKVVQNLYNALCYLGQNPPKDAQISDCREILSWAISHWRLSQVPSQASR